MSAPLFALRDVSVRFGGLRALDRFSMEVAGGTIHALIGPNGAGKSTVFNCVSRFYHPTEGDILFEGQSLLTRPGARRSRRAASRAPSRTSSCAAA